MKIYLETCGANTRWKSHSVFSKSAKGICTGVVIITTIPGFKFATAAKRKNGHVAEKYLFMTCTGFRSERTLTSR
jgi:hypothetical protein